MMDIAGTAGTLPERHIGRGSKSNPVQGRGGEERQGGGTNTVPHSGSQVATGQQGRVDKGLKLSEVCPPVKSGVVGLEVPRPLPALACYKAPSLESERPTFQSVT